MSNSHSHHSRDSPDIDDDMLLFDCLPPFQPPLQDDHPLQALVQTLSSLALCHFNRAKALETARSLNNLHLHTIKPKCPRQQHHRTTQPQQPPQPPAKQLACPFYKLNPNRHQLCLMTEFSSIQSLKQHIIIHHHAPISCAICHDTFASAVLRDAHIVSRTCVERDQLRDYLAGVNEDQVQLLMLRDHDDDNSGGTVVSRRQPSRRRRGHPRRGTEITRAREIREEQRWFRVWDIVFPDEPRPDSGFLTTQRETEAVALRGFWRRHAHKMIGAALREEDERDKEVLEALQASVLKDMMGHVL